MSNMQKTYKITATINGKTVVLRKRSTRAYSLAWIGVDKNGDFDGYQPSMSNDYVSLNNRMLKWISTTDREEMKYRQIIVETTATEITPKTKTKEPAGMTDKERAEMIALIAAYREQNAILRKQLAK
jgi:hypothetical protein